ncbi:hypothetical protein [Nonomuraea gerenzanensis]|uniref:Secreted protein n=1 Tax=Nonomuraea gerenzanensis TaxID=93944 RepID=A0A1M4ECM1_9ACTN|nr:hypothetical protein [Nonomuraea gerenzanensis]UBU18700.1 hypothetical protein LCN96_27895 [Nonomuraea gerenzanensis]SBO96560.1 hypothetical protein BN4615_P6076 [Nonomuraea gerenzanensis]
MSRASLRLATISLGLAAFAGGTTPVIAAAAAAPVSIYGYYPSAESCHSVGQQGRSTGLWPWYTCFPSNQLWALQIPW